MAVSRAITAVEGRGEERPPENLMPQNITTIDQSNLQSINHEKDEVLNSLALKYHQKSQSKDHEIVKVDSYIKEQNRIRDS